MPSDADAPTLEARGGPVAFDSRRASRGRGPGVDRGALVAALLIAFVALAVVKPWTGGGSPAPPPRAAPAPVGPSPRVGSGAPSGSARGSASPAFSGSSPGRTGPSVGALAAALAASSGRWGVGSAGYGPALGRVGQWSAWVPVTPVDDVAAPGGRRTVPSGSTAARAACRTAWLPGAGAIVALTVPTGLPPDWRIESWQLRRTPIPLAGQLRQVSPPGNRGIAYLVTKDGSSWPAAAYRFVVVAGDHRSAIDVCLGSVGTAAGFATTDPRRD